MKNKKIVIGIGAMVAGGGHIALKDYLLEELKDDKRFELASFVHSNKSYDKLNNMQGKISYFNHLLFKTTPGEFLGFSAILILSDCEKFIKDHNPDIMISTHSSLAAAFAVVKRSLKLNFINIDVIPDYGIPGDVILPTGPYVKPDYMVFLDDRAKLALKGTTKFPKNKVIVTGYVAKKSYRKMIAEYKQRTKEELIEELKNDLGRTFTQDLSKDKRTIIITCGSGGIVNKSYGLLKHVVKHQKENPSLINRYQILIMTGTNTKFFNKLFKHHVNEENDWSNIIPIPWVNHDVYSKIQYIADFPVMITVAPASINELCEAGCGPLLIHSSRRGQEMGNIEFVVKNHLGFYMPKKKDVLNKIFNGFNLEEEGKFKEEAEKYRNERINKIEKFPDQLVNIYNQNIKPERKQDKNRLKLKINYKLVSPKAWLSFIFAAIPTTILFGEAQYYKQKNNPVTKKVLQTAMNYLSKIYEL